MGSNGSESGLQRKQGTEEVDSDIDKSIKLQCSTHYLRICDKR